MDQAAQQTIQPRDPDTVMTLARLGAAHQTRLSFMRQLLRRLVRDDWTITQTSFDIDAGGVGHAVYTAQGPDHAYSLVAFAHDLPADQRSDRVIATAWDATFTLFDGIPTKTDIARLRDNVPLQESGRISDRELSLSRANRSVRLWDHVVGALSQGHQPDEEQVRAVGYLMRTTAVYGSGKFGAADREQTRHRPECAGPFQIEMLSVYLTRCFVMDLVEHMARARAPKTAVPLDPALRRRFGIGNSTGLGMAPFLVNHPALLNAWVAAREEALARVRSQPAAPEATAQAFRRFAARAQVHAEGWHSAHPMQIEKCNALRTDMTALMAHLDTADLTTDHPWNRLWLWGEAHLSLEGQEQLASLLLEPYGDLVDDLTRCMAADEQASFPIDGTMSTNRLKAIIEDVYAWALGLDWTAPDAQARVWYTSQAKLEPRLGERALEPIEPYEQPLGPGRDAVLAHAALRDAPQATVAEFLLAHPRHRHIARRAQIAARLPYAEIRDNTLSADMLPVDMLRLKLSFFGACHFDPRSDRWLRINMFQHAPFPHELAEMGDDWTLPPLPGSAQ
ncbi:hypothetical protein [Roseovarius atlanticus]|uniref:hypothetical protein n=1 Tax=Roseovarius atlanticus TaxID=1641875 RepID=UPI001C96F597|nr:hypothetical protein [Roseovarius atlanticus]MBY5990413.1 hypothetical protein [Roseovarius atlanticus]MBY6126959.1 hypothetical protein [Roseovarius atlanticus]MBY6151452.1 hypothetical protein [Roseovarius atlanticus]